MFCDGIFYGPVHFGFLSIVFVFIRIAGFAGNDNVQSVNVQMMRIIRLIFVKNLCNIEAGFGKEYFIIDAEKGESICTYQSYFYGMPQRK